MDNPSFAGVHPSLVNELNAFDGHIAAQIRDAYCVGDGMFAVSMENSRERRMREDEFERRREREREEMEVEREQQMEVEVEVERQQMEMEMQQMEREMLEQRQLEMREMEMRQRQIQEQQRSQQQQQQQQYQRQQQQKLEQQRQLQLRQEAQRSEQQQRQFRHQQEQQQHQHQRYQLPQYQQQYEQQPTAFGVSAPAPQHTLTNSQSFPGLRQEYHQHQQPHQSQPQHSMYPIPPEYRQQHHPGPELTSSLSPTTTTFGSSDLGRGYDAHPHPQPIVVDADTRGGGDYWAAAPTGHCLNPGQIPLARQDQNQQAVYQQHHYTPEAALKGIAADDRSLQETWQSYMYNVSSFFYSRIG